MAQTWSITKAVIPVAGKASRHFPASAVLPKGLFPLVDADGVTRATIHIILRYARQGGIEQVALVVSPGQEEAFRGYFTRHEDALAGRLGPKAMAEAREIVELAGRITYITQAAPAGFGHAVWCAKSFVAGQPFLVMLGDYVYSNCSPGADNAPENGVRQLRAAFDACKGVSVTGVRASPASEIELCGTLGCDLADGLMYRVRDIVEKPSLDVARSRLSTEGLGSDEFLTHAGLYAFAPAIFDALEQVMQARQAEAGEVQLTDAQRILLNSGEPYYALRIAHMPLDMGTPAGLARTQSLLFAESPSTT